MRAYDLILKKRNGGELSREEIDFLLSGYVRGTIPDYQLSAFTMAVYFRGMSKKEILDFTLAMVESGNTISLQEIPGIKVDKHSTGGVGDTTTLVLAPLVAAAGVPVAKMSGRGLGHTGGTLDKLASIPGFQVDLTGEEFFRIVRETGAAVAGQTGDLVPADKKLYALRDVTATVDSLPLIAASIMSKKLASGADALVLDVKAGDGAFLKELDQAFTLAETMVEIGEGAGRRTTALISSMDQPLGRAVGNALEVEEAIRTLKGQGPADLAALCLALGGEMLYLAGKAPDPEKGSAALKRLLDSGAALEKLRRIIDAQHGDSRVVDDTALLPQARHTLEIKAGQAGFVQRIKAESVGLSAMLLGAGRETKESEIDLAAGVVLNKKVGDPVNAGEVLAVMHTGFDPGSSQVEAARRMLLAAFECGPEKPAPPPLILGRVDRHGAVRY
ncbi:MAG TPA: pyrimidine-nucleoside phosphorylase [Bacillota bacterium]|nr:pyrimidine-nucleoside phosphorylase [Bacillota bacterium]